MTIRLAIVNDYEVVVHGLASMLRSYSDRIEVVEVDANAHPVSAVDIALFDTFAQSFRDRERIARLVRDPRIGKVVVYTWSADDPSVGQTRVPGISAYVSKRLAAADLVDRAREDATPASRCGCTTPGRGPLVGGDWPGREEGLTARESEVLSLITQGYSNNDIVETTMLSINSIKSYIRSAYRKIGVTSRSRAILWGIDHGFQPDRARLTRRAAVARRSLTSRGGAPWHRQPAATAATSRRTKRLDRNWNELLQELRITQTGLQLLSGFLLTLAFTQVFGGLDDRQKALYLALVVIAGVAVGLNLMPMMMHRRVFGEHVKGACGEVGHVVAQMRDGRHRGPRGGDGDPDLLGRRQLDRRHRRGGVPRGRAGRAARRSPVASRSGAVNRLHCSAARPALTRG